MLQEHGPTVGAPLGVQGNPVEDDALDLVDDGGALVLVVNLDEGVGRTSIGLCPLMVGEGFFHLDFKVPR